MSNPQERLSVALQRLAGYLNFSSGSSDPATLSAWNEAYEVASRGDPLSGPPAWLVIEQCLRDKLAELAETQVAFAATEQASRVIRLLWSELLPAYLDFHRDLLFHQQPELIFNGFFLARCADAILAELGNPDDEAVVESAIETLNDFVGYRPVAVLENRRCTPYPHEFIRPVPLFVTAAGVSAGPYREIVMRALAILRDTDPEILRSASFDPDRLTELAFDPRAYDFDHPVNRRPNDHFGCWDDRQIDADGYFTRFVIRQVTLDALLSRVGEAPELDGDEVLAEAATVLAGTMLMASGVSGWGPGAHTSDVTLTSLMKPIASYRDAFYDDCLGRLAGSHAARLEKEQQTRHQAFGAARQHLNAALARCRAVQLQHAQLARLFARMGFPEAATRQTDVVPAASARMMCRIDCAVTLGMRAMRSGDLDRAMQVPGEVFDLIRRGIDCGALIDPWDILAFGGNFSLFPSPECSIHDGRVDDLLYLIEQLFGYTAKVWSETAARDDERAYRETETALREMAEWWRQFAAHTVESIEAIDPLETYESARLVAQALRLWHRGGAAAGDVAFWAPHADLFDSPRAYGLVVSALLEREDLIPAMALLVHWLSQADRIGLRLGGSSLPRLAERWLLRLRGSRDDVVGTPDVPAAGHSDADRSDVDRSDAGDSPGKPAADWGLVQKLFDYFEANADQYWSPPTFRLGDRSRPGKDWDRELLAADGEEGSGDEGLYDAAYEGVTYRDTTDDGNEGAVFESGDDGSQDELEAETKRLIDHLSFLQSLARMWAVAADIALTLGNDDEGGRERLGSLRAWADRARHNRVGLLELLDSVREFAVRPAGTDKDSMRSYDRRRVLRDSLMERVINAAVEMSDSRRLICGALHALDPADSGVIDEEMAEDDAGAIELFAALIGNDRQRARDRFPTFLGVLHNKNLLYIPLSRGGDPVKIYVARLRQRVLRHLMHWLPRRGLVAESCRLIETARRMEQQNPIGFGAVTEFDGLFRDGFRALVAAIVESVRLGKADITERRTTTTSGTPPRAGKATPASEGQIADELIPLLEQLTETMLGSWLAHSQTLRLSPLELVTESGKWQRLVRFVRDYGDPLFTQAFLQLSNVRAVLHQGVSAWLRRAIEEGDDQLEDTRFLEDLRSGILSIAEAERWTTLVYETVIDHHAEYLDYNSTTTQSDRGDLVYMFLDFLRLRVRYERIAWNLKPVMWAHEVLVRSGLEQAAMTWRRSLSDRIGTEAEIYVQKLKKLQADYSMKMPTVADRINERFIQPMTIDRIRALIGPAMRDAESDDSSRSFELLEEQAELLTRNPTGVGLDVPVWLEALDEEVEKLAKRQANSEIDPQSLIHVPIVPLSPPELSEQLATARSQGRGLPHIR